MKKLTIFILIISLTLAFCSCLGDNKNEGNNDSGDINTNGDNVGGNNDPDDNNDNTSPANTDGTGNTDEIGDIGDLDIGDIYNSDNMYIYSEFSAAEKAALVAQGKEEGVDIDFKADGSTTFKYSDGTSATQNKDGHWVFTDAEGNDVSYIGEGDWPDNEFTKQIPKPKMKTALASIVDGAFSVIFSEDVTLDALRDYVDELKSAGFNNDVELTDETIMGIVIYSFTANNSNGYNVNVYYSGGIAGMAVTK